jgi:hypothetical protein
MAKKRIEIAQELDLIGFWTDCVTNHPYSQKEMIAFGAQETGVLLGATPSRDMVGLQSFLDTRMSFLSCYLPLKNKHHTIYLPKNHIDFISNLSQKSNLTRTILESSAQGVGESEYATQVNPEIQMASIKVQHIGKDFIHSINAELEKLEPLNLPFTLLNLPISQEAASLAFSELEKIGFFWGAWLPNHSQHGDVLRLQKLHTSVNVDEIICAREQGEEVKNFVVSEWKRVSKK